MNSKFRDLQIKLKQEEMRMLKQRLLDRIELDNSKDVEMENYKNGVPYVYDESSRLDRVKNKELQKQKLRQKLVQLFVDDKDSIDEIYNDIAMDDEDVLYFNSNYNKIYNELSNLIDLEYLTAPYFQSFYNRYKQKYNDTRFGIDLQQEYNDEITDILLKKENKNNNINTITELDIKKFLSKKRGYNEYGLYGVSLMKELDLDNRMFYDNNDELIQESGTKAKSIKIISDVYKWVYDAKEYKIQGKTDKIEKLKDKFNKYRTKPLKDSVDVINYVNEVINLIPDITAKNIAEMKMIN